MQCDDEKEDEKKELKIVEKNPSEWLREEGASGEIEEGNQVFMFLSKSD